MYNGYATSVQQKIMVMYVCTTAGEPNNMLTQCLGEVNTVIEDCSVLYMLGDYNADPTASFGEELFDFCRERQWIYAVVV